MRGIFGVKKEDMKKAVIVPVILMTLCAASAGKIERRKLGIFQGSVPETETLATGTTEFVYGYSYCVDTTGTIDDNISSDQMLLQIAPGGMSKFSSYRNLTVDSLIANMTAEQLQSAVVEGKLSNGEFMTIYKNYPAGRITHTEKICTDWFRYEEDMPDLQWELTDSTAVVLGYECRSAECTFRGRKWKVLYSEDIPVAEGPWKLSGLPGLIMKACDEQGHYNFECIGIRSSSDRPITMYKVPFNVTTREEYYDTRHRYEVNPYAYFEATTGGHVTVTDEAGNIVPDSYDPIELPFEYIERDWKK